MKNNITLKIGQMVSWDISNLKMVGAVLYDNGEDVSIQTHFRGSCPFYQEVTVNKSKLILK